jgi:hypothetical protein
MFINIEGNIKHKCSFALHYWNIFHGFVMDVTPTWHVFQHQPIMYKCDAQVSWVLCFIQLQPLLQNVFCVCSRLAQSLHTTKSPNKLVDIMFNNPPFYF